MREPAELFLRIQIQAVSRVRAASGRESTEVAGGHLSFPWERSGIRFHVK
jgi:hypothetical protein